MQYRHVYPVAANSQQHTAIHSFPLPCHSRTKNAEEGWNQRQQIANCETRRVTTGNAGGERCDAGKAQRELQGNEREHCKEQAAYGQNGTGGGHGEMAVYSAASAPSWQVGGGDTCWVNCETAAVPLGRCGGGGVWRQNAHGTSGQTDTRTQTRFRQPS